MCTVHKVLPCIVHNKFALTCPVYRHFLCSCKCAQIPYAGPQVKLVVYFTEKLFTQTISFDPDILTYKVCNKPLCFNQVGGLLNSKLIHVLIHVYILILLQIRLSHYHCNANVNSVKFPLLLDAALAVSTIMSMITDKLLCAVV